MPTSILARTAYLLLLPLFLLLSADIAWDDIRQNCVCLAKSLCIRLVALLLLLFEGLIHAPPYFHLLLPRVGFALGMAALLFFVPFGKADKRAICSVCFIFPIRESLSCVSAACLMAVLTVILNRIQQRRTSRKRRGAIFFQDFPWKHLTQVSSSGRPALPFLPFLAIGLFPVSGFHVAGLLAHP